MKKLMSVFMLTVVLLSFSACHSISGGKIRKYTLGSTFKHDGMKYTIGPSADLISRTYNNKLFVRLFIKVKNVSGDTKDMSLYFDFFDPKKEPVQEGYGFENRYYPESLSKNEEKSFYLYFEYTEDGDYIVESINKGDYILGGDDDNFEIKVPVKK